MQIKLNNGTAFDCFRASAKRENFQGSNRAMLEFYFSEGVTTFDELNTLFSNAENTKAIEITDDSGNVSLFENYTIRAALRYTPFEVSPETDTSPAVTEMKLIVTLAQKTYNEFLTEQLQETVDALVLSELGV